MKKIIVIGGGVTGLSVAWKLSEKGYEVKVIEMDEFIGGLARSIKMGNYFFDIGPHAFTTKDEEVFKKVMDLFKSEPGEMLYTKRTVKMMFRGKYVDYPLSVKVLFQMGIIPAIMCSLSFVKSKIRTSISSLLGKKIEYQNLTIKQWAIDNYGKYLYLNFFKPYTEQFWKIETSELSHRVIPSSTKTDFMKALAYIVLATKHALTNKYLELSKREPGELSLVERESLPRYYPKKGFGEITNRIAKLIKSNGGEIYTSQEVNEIILNSENSFDVKTKNKTFSGDFVVSTIPLNRVITKIKPLHEAEIIQSAKKLEYLSLVLLYLITKKQNILGCLNCYFIDKPYNRISEMNFFSKSLSPKDENILAVEISCHYESDIWKSSDKEIFSMCVQGLEKDNFLKKADVINYKVIKVPSVYPIYRKDYDIHLKETQECFKKIKNFYSIGRQGQFYYGDIDQMIRIGFDTADKIIKQ
jgi:protoporphyrinogen oxidase